MQCPVCNALLKTYKYHKLIVDICPTCNGIWYDPGELNEFIEDLLIDADDIPEAKIEPERKVIKRHTISEPERTCLRCHQPMEKINYAYDSNIIVDRCPACGGVWVDGGEIEQIASHTRGNPKLHAMAYSMIEAHKETEEEINKVQTVLINILYLLRGLL